MTRLGQVIAHGNRGHHQQSLLREVGWPPESRIECVDGFSVSVIAGGGTYCTPRPALCTCGLLADAVRRTADGILWKVDCDYPGPYREVEVGYPSQRPEPWDGPGGWSEHFEDWGDTDPTEAVYGYVPVEMVRALIAAHGGEA